ncbi:MAG: type I restriction-modification enzyme R subunit C-terminal domain-containing protein, partial [Patescibacteria group bacterium]
YKHFSDPEWDGDPVEDVCPKCGQEPCVCKKKPKEVCPICGERPCVCEKPPKPCPRCGQIPCICENKPKTKLKIKLRDGKEREIQHMIATSFWSADGKPISLQEFLNNMIGTLPEFFKNEEGLRKIWSNPTTRKVFLDKIAAVGYGKDELETLQKMIAAEKSDLFDVLTYISFLTQPISRTQRVEQSKDKIFKGLDDKQKEFLDFVLSKYEEKGVEELDEEKLPVLLNLKYHAIANAEQRLGSVDNIRSIFFAFQKNLYAKIGR